MYRIIGIQLDRLSRAPEGLTQKKAIGSFGRSKVMLIFSRVRIALKITFSDPRLLKIQEIVSSHG